MWATVLLLLLLLLFRREGYIADTTFVHSSVHSATPENTKSVEAFAKKLHKANCDLIIKIKTESEV